MEGATKIHFKNLDAIRFIAASLVLLDHCFSNSYQYLNIKGTFTERLLYTISNGQNGVSLFFVLSGFLITYIILSEIRATGSFSVKNFYIRRVLRIWPLYFAVLILVFFVFPYFKAASGNEVSPARMQYYFSFLSNFDVVRVKKCCHAAEELRQSVTWSVAIEEQFYAFWPLIFAFLPRRFFLFAIILVACGSLIFRFFFYQDEIVLHYQTFAVLLELAVGGLYAYIIFYNKKVRTFFENIRSWALFISIAITLASLVFIDSIFAFKYGMVLSRFYIDILFGFIIISQCMTKSNSMFELGKIGIADRLGKYTYGIYLLHPIALLIVTMLLKKLHWQTTNFYGAFSSGAITVVLTIFISILSYTYFEKRFLKLKSRFSSVISG